MQRWGQLFLSASLRQSHELMLKARQHCHALRLAVSSAGVRDFDDYAEGALTLVLPGGVRVIGLPARPATVRGFTGDVFLDEFAMHTDDREIWAAMFPTLLRDRGEIDVASTPKGRDNQFARLADNDRFEPSWLTIHQAVAAGLPVDVEQLRAAMDDDLLFRQEFECEMLDERIAFLPHALIAEVEDASLSPQVHWAEIDDARAPLFAGVDVGRSRDLTVVWLWQTAPPGVFGESPIARPQRSDDSAPALRCVGLIEMRDEPFAAQADLLGRLFDLGPMRRLCVDATGIGMQLAEQAVQRFGAHRVEAVTFTAAIKAELAHRLRIAIERRRVRIPADPEVRNDFHSVRREITSSGQVRFDAPRRTGGHADRFWAAALALRAAGADPGPLDHRRGRALTFSRPGAW